ncbi:glycosyltransferase family 4 protein [Lachnospiraceae bacterium 56-18]|uniref:glycosyltransferase family 4 protein n=1 Tax=Sporofaciens sp. JLR.KK001 TaxID=3112621 RepID=UPI002FEEDA91
MKFLLFGTGEYYNRYKIWFAKEDIIALIDNSKEKQGQYIDNILVIPPEAVCQYEFDAIVILSFYVKAMKFQLIQLGIEESRIYHFFDLHNLIYHQVKKRAIHYYEPKDKNESENKKILLLSHDLTLGGPALALYHAAQILRKNGYQAVYGSMLDGPLRRTLTEEGIPIIVDENLMIETMKEAEWTNGYSLIICNTMNYHVFLSERGQNVPVVWWLHDALFFYDGIRQEVMEKISQDNMQIWSVGPIPKKAVQTFRPDLQIEDLLYGVADQADRKNKVNSDSVIRFITIGYIEHRKGQDILLEAIKGLEDEFRKKAEFIFVGQNTSLMAQNLIEASGNIPEIVITGLVDREEIDTLLDRSDVLVCPSREDPMPTVAAEAMMHGLPCLISDTTGTVQYIGDGIDSIVFQSGNAEQLREMLRRCIRGSYNLKEMGRNARGVYEKYFSMQAFENRLMELVEDLV